ncbi:MAG TPA: CBS domain-containing protein [Candidatus Saccharimonadales bacterium]|nr:CBS domain-containing protein [Candidatus Saccharimonadales bacterium]
MEWLVLICAILLTGLLSVVKSFQYAPSQESQFELDRRAAQGDGVAAYEIVRRPLLPTFIGLRVLKIVVITSVMATLLLAWFGVWGLCLLVLLWLLSELCVAKGWVQPVAIAAQRMVEPRIIHMVPHTRPVFKHFAPVRSVESDSQVSSREELLHILNHDTQLLEAAEKARVQGALSYGSLTIADVMVPRDAIATVRTSETVGPVLLTRLHKEGHAIFVAVEKDLSHVEGLLYMADATSGHPGIKTVADAIRPTVHYLAQDEPLDSVLAASLQSGRQLFIVVDNQGNISGLITLADALAKLLGAAPPVQTRLSTDPTKV